MTPLPLADRANEDQRSVSLVEPAVAGPASGPPWSGLTHPSLDWQQTASASFAHTPTVPTGNRMLHSIRLVSMLAMVVACSPVATCQAPAQAAARLSVKRVAGPTGNPHSAWTDALVHSWVADASAICERDLGIRLELAELIAIQDPGTAGGWYYADGSVATAMELAAIAQPETHAWRSNMVNVYLIGGTIGGICSFPANSPHREIILLGPYILNGAVGLAHEMGHYFGLRHTHANYEGMGGGCNGGGQAGDCVWDTQNDIDPYQCSTSSCREAALRALGYAQADYLRLRYNVMSYHGPTSPIQGLFTPGQRQKALESSLRYRQHVMSLRWNAIPWGWAWPGAAGAGLRPIVGDYDGDGWTDRAVYNPSNCACFVISSRTNLPLASVPWGAAPPGMNSQFRPSVGDFDGDGLADRCFTNMTNGNWYVLLTSGNGAGTGANCLPWGWTWLGSTPFTPIVADYTGDGRVDAAIIVNSSPPRWFIRSSSNCNPYNGVPALPWGSSWNGYGAGVHRLATADYDGDGKADPTIVDPSGNWYCLASSGNSPIPWGWNWRYMGAETRPVPGDYDGDGLDDKAIMSPTSGAWFIINTSGAPSVHPWGLSMPWGPHFEAVPSDYDGDGRTDPAVVDTATGKWYVRASSNLYDLPQPSALLWGPAPGPIGSSTTTMGHKPLIGESVRIWTHGFPPNQAAYTLLSFTPGTDWWLPSLSAPLAAQVGTGAVFGPVIVDNSGYVSHSFAIPNSPALRGTIVVAQQAGFTTQPPFLLISNSVIMTLGQ